MLLWQISLFQRSKANHNAAWDSGAQEKLWQISLFQRSKANHNPAYSSIDKCSVVANIIISKIESKSQPSELHKTTSISCGKYHYFKDRKQITTVHPVAKFNTPLWQISLFQRSKANHNGTWHNDERALVVANIIISKIESKSQLYLVRTNMTTCCGKYHYFKDRKQITTSPGPGPNYCWLWQISLFQRSKANHNSIFSSTSLTLLWQISLFQRSKANHNSKC